MIPFVLYPSITTATIIWGLEQVSLCPNTPLCGLGTSDPGYENRLEYVRVTMSQIAGAVGFAGVFVTVLVSIFWIVLRFRWVGREKVFSVNALISLATSLRSSSIYKGEELLTESERVTRRQEEWKKATVRVFDVFDLDNSGSVDVKELRDIVTAMYPIANANLIRSSMIKAKVYADADGELEIVVATSMGFIYVLQARSSVFACPSRVCRSAHVQSSRVPAHCR